jgi:cytochrome d ubiquinol oxidase subunit II
VAQQPYLLPFSLTVEDGAGAAASLRWLLIWAAIALVTVVPALVLLYVLDQRGELGEDPTTSRQEFSPSAGDSAGLNRGDPHKAGREEVH